METLPGAGFLLEPPSQNATRVHFLKIFDPVICSLKKKISTGEKLTGGEYALIFLSCGSRLVLLEEL